MVTLAELENEPYIDHIPSDGRVIFGTIYYNDLKGKFEENTTGLKIIDFYKQTYWSKEIVDTKKDIELNLINLLVNNYSFDEITNLCSSVEQDIFNFGALIEKQRILWKFYQVNDSKIDLTDSYMTEFEYLMGLIRSFYDLLFDIYKGLREIYKPKHPKLPNTLGSLSDKIDKKGWADVKLTYGLEKNFIKFLKGILPLFETCRRIRNDIYHKGKYPKSLVFQTAKGPAIGFMKPHSKDEFNPFYYLKDYVIRDQVFAMNMLPNEVGSFFYFINKMIKLTIDSSETFADTIETIFKSQSISNEYKTYLRGPTIMQINEIPINLEKCWITQDIGIIERFKIFLSKYLI